ncbi:MAG: hypothetical protein ABR898_14215 [Terracidiphilus sp.]
MEINPGTAASIGAAPAQPEIDGIDLVAAFKTKGANTCVAKKREKVRHCLRTSVAHTRSRRRARAAGLIGMAFAESVLRFIAIFMNSPSRWTG